MKRLYIVKTGTTFPDTQKEFGDFDAWIRAGLEKAKADIHVLDVRREGPVPLLPVARACAGIVITGSHAMVTERHPWSVQLEKWVPFLLESRVSLLGICYGHKLLAQAVGGRVEIHPGAWRSAL